MLPKLHKSKEINEIIEIKFTDYIQTDENILIEVRPLQFFTQVEYRKFYIVLWNVFYL